MCLYALALSANGQVGFDPDRIHVEVTPVDITPAGLAAPHENPKNILAKLQGLLTDRGYNRAASRFAEKYHFAWLEDQTQSMIDDIDRLL